MLHEQRALGPLIRVRETANQTVIIAASIENEALSDFIRAGIVSTHVDKPRPSCLSGNIPPSI